MLVVREEWYTENFYTISIEDDMICFGILEGRSHTLIYYNLEELNSQFFVDFTLETLSESINRLSTDCYTLLIDTLKDFQLGFVPVDEVYIMMHQLFAKGFNFGEEKEKYPEHQGGHYLGIEGDLFSIELKDGNYGCREFLFKKAYYHEFFSTHISSDYTIDILSKIPSSILYQKIYSYYVEKKFNKIDSPEIEKVLKPIGRKEKIASLLNDSKD
jgi:hypothetical protein